MMYRLCYATWILLVLCLPAAASVIDLRLPLIEDLDGSSLLELRVDTVDVALQTGSGVFNRTGAGFGINSPGGGDDADAIDGALGSEALTVRFGRGVRLLGLTLSAFSRTDRALLVVSDGATLLDASGFLDLEIELTAMLPFELRHTAGNGFSLDAIHFEALPAAAPRPSVSVVGPDTWGLVAIGLTALMAGRARARRITAAARGRRNRPMLAPTPAAGDNRDLRSPSCRHPAGGARSTRATHATT